MLEKLESAFDVEFINSAESPVCLSVAIPRDSCTLDLKEFPISATPQAGRVANGRGWNEESCRWSCLGEAAELLSCCEWGDEELKMARAIDLGDKALSAPHLLGLSKQQYLLRDDWNKSMAKFDWRPRPQDPGSTVAWLAVTDAYTNEQYYAPADFVLIGRREAGDDRAIAIGDSNGCASANDLSTAKLKAALELIERDAVARWWYGQRSRPELAVRGSVAMPGIAEWMLVEGRQLSLVDIRTDIAVPAVAAISANLDGSDVTLGSAAALTWNSAVTSAVSELLQMEYTLKVVRDSPELSTAWDQWRRTVNMTTPPLGLITGSTEVEDESDLRDPDERLSKCIDACHKKGVSIFFIDMSRSSLRVPVVRAMSLDLCHYKPRFDRTRLLAPDLFDAAVASKERNSTYLLV